MKPIKEFIFSSAYDMLHIKHRISGQEPFSKWNREVGEEWFYKNGPFKMVDKADNLITSPEMVCDIGYII